MVQPFCLVLNILGHFPHPPCFSLPYRKSLFPSTLLWNVGGMVEIEDFLLGFFIYAACVRLVGSVKLGVGVQGREKAALVIGGTPHPAIGHARPLSNGIAGTDQILSTSRG